MNVVWAWIGKGVYVYITGGTLECETASVSVALCHALQEPTNDGDAGDAEGEEGAGKGGKGAKKRRGGKK